jgi:hypothetical protein
MSSQGPNYAGSASGWTSSSSVGADDGVVASAAWSYLVSEGVPEPTPTAYLTAKTFGLAIGAGDAINGILVEIEVRKTSATPVGNLKAFLARGGTQIGATKTITGLTTALTSYNLGSNADNWGSSSWNGGNIGQLQVVVFGDPTGSVGAANVEIDYIRVSIDYTDATPNAFSFTDVTSQALSSVITSDTITVAGISAAAAVSLSGTGASKEWRKNGGAWGSGAGTVVNGDTVQLRQTSSGSNNTATTVICTIGGVSDTWSVTTLAVDTTPDAFSFTDKTAAEPGTQYTSNSLQISGINAAAAVSISGSTGEWRKQTGGVWGAWGSAAGTVVNLDYVQVRGTSSASFSTNRDIVLTIGGVADTYRITTRAADTVPNPFAFADVAAATLGLQYTSNTITVGGIEAAANCTFSTTGNGTGHQYSKNGGAWTALGATTLNSGDTLAVRMNAPAGAAQTGNITVTIGGVADTYTVATATDTTPDAFAFTTANRKRPGRVVTSTSATITGINAAVTATVSAGDEFEINGGGVWVTSGDVSNGNTVKVRGRSSLRAGGQKVVSLTLGGVTGTFTINTVRSGNPPTT